MSVTETRDMGEFFLADVVRHLVDGDTREAEGMLRVLSAEKQIEACEKGLLSLGETLEYYHNRLLRWSIDVNKWDVGYTFRWDGKCTHESKGMEELRLKDFELYKKFIKAGKGIPYYKEYDVGGVECTKVAIRSTERALEWLQRRLEEHKGEADRMAIIEDAEAPELGPNFIHWKGVKDSGERKLLDIETNAYKWSLSYIFRMMGSLRNKQSNREITRRHMTEGVGLLYKELYNRTQDEKYAVELQGLREVWKELYGTSPAQEEEEAEPIVNPYEGCDRQWLTEDEMIYAIDASRPYGHVRNTSYHDEVSMEFAQEYQTLEDEVNFYLDFEV